MGENIGRCCICIPTRLGVFLLACSMFLMGISNLIGLVIQDARFVSGGYSYTAFAISSAVGCAGLIFGFTGCLGAHDNSAGLVGWFAFFYVVSLVAHAVVFSLDMVTLGQCETWLTSVESQTSYNPTLEAIARNGLCEWTKYSYVTGFTVDFVMGIYFAFVIYKYKAVLESKPASLLRFPADAFVPGAGLKAFNDERMKLVLHAH
eukprot:GDKH01003475.1.p1 GENE.GDKH01003475.1~~GDKH01003475.1.p1  ORF type:complete len:205 (-),score=32.34 GDKH01003475.1:426-1040(-)